MRRGLSDLERFILVEANKPDGVHTADTRRSGERSQVSADKTKPPKRKGKQ